MAIDMKTTLEAACRALLRPVASVLLKGGMTWREFSNLSKSVFVDVASTEYGRRGRPTNVSRVSILTGISRKEVKRQRELLLAPAKHPASSKTTDATRLLSGWHQDDDFKDAAGEPRPLDADEVATLFAKYGGDTPQQTLLRELQNAGSVEAGSNGKLVARRRYHMPVQMDAGSLRFFGTNLHDHANTLCRNLAGEPADRRFEGFAVDEEIHPDAADEFRAFLELKGQTLLEEVDDWLSRHRVNPKHENTEPVRVGVGIYAIEGSLPEGTLS